MRVSALCAIVGALVPLLAAVNPANAEIVGNAAFGEWRMKCSLDYAAKTKRCSIWAGPMTAESPVGTSAQLTLFIDPETPYVAIASMNAEFIKLQIDDDKPIFVDCSHIGMCELSAQQARELVEGASHGVMLLIRMALLSGLYEKSLPLGGYRTVFDDFLEEQRLYETNLSHQRKHGSDNSSER